MKKKKESAKKKKNNKKSAFEIDKVVTQVTRTLKVRVYVKHKVHRARVYPAHR